MREDEDVTSFDQALSQARPDSHKELMLWRFRRLCKRFEREPNKTFISNRLRDTIRELKDCGFSIEEIDQFSDEIIGSA